LTRVGAAVLILTFGHGTASAERIVALLRGAEVGRLVDVRTAPGSRRNPDVTRDAMSRWLPEAGIAYRWEKRLGGWRKSRPDSPDTALRNRAFGGYAAHMRSPEFLAAIDDLLAEAAPREGERVSTGDGEPAEPAGWVSTGDGEPAEPAGWVSTALTAVMCAESLWWRCHRKMIADFLVLAHGVRVRHLLHDGALWPHVPSPEARLLPEHGLLVYDGGQPPLLG
jgi:uncharacterized protein (DUF488 family)